jgi:hypothetical protein
MPNWVMNELTCIFQTPEEYNAFKEKANPESFYNSFIPMPPVLEGTQSPHVDVDKFIIQYNEENDTKYTTLEQIASFGNDWNKVIALHAMQNIKAFEETGYHDWYSWNLTNWGVKWDAVRCTSKELQDFNTIIFAFDSPWGTPEHFVRQLSSLYPNATFEMVSGSIENDTHYEFTCCDGNFEETCSYETFKEAVVDGKWGGWNEWAEMFQEDEV